LSLCSCVSSKVRDEATGKGKGFAFVKYEDQRSTILAVDNFNGTTILGRTIRVDHVLKYKLPKHLQDKVICFKQSLFVC